MAAKPEEVTTAPAEAAPAAAPEVGSAAEPSPAPAAVAAEPATEEKKVDETTAAVAHLSVEDKKEEKPEEAKETEASTEKKTEDATSSVAAAPTPATEPVAEKETPTAVPADSLSGPVWPETSPEHPLTKFYDLIEELCKEADHHEVWGITLSKDTPFQTKFILQKFLRANQNDLNKAKDQLLDTLKWRKEFDPIKATQEGHDKEKFDGLGYIIEVEGVPGSDNAKDIVTFNIYGAVKDIKKTFGDVNEFLRWRVGLMERSIQRLNLQNATKPIPNYGEGPDPYQSFQVHDYLQVSFFSQDKTAKAATNETIKVLGRYYPETLSRKFFVNVPVIMGWFYNAVKLVIAKETVKKFTVLSYGNTLASELGQNIPKEYGGNTGELKEVGEGMKFQE